jgi:hypothetical protein
MTRIERQSSSRIASASTAPDTTGAAVQAESLLARGSHIRKNSSQLLESSHQAVFYPLGFPVRVLSNSPAILHAAQQSWGSFRPAFSHPPLELRLAVKYAASGSLPPVPTHSLRGNLLINSADTDNFIIANLSTGHALGWVTEATAASPLYLRYYFLEGSVLSMISARRAVAVHGACLLIENKGILLCGDSGAGKSTLAYAGARAGWTYVSDDASYLLLDHEDALVVGNYLKIRFRPTAADLFPEIDGRPITPRAAGKPSVEVQTSEWPEIATAPLAKVSQIIFLNRKHQHDEVIRLSGTDVMPWFMQHLLPNTSARKAQESAISRLLESEILELRYRDLAWAIQRVNQISSEQR